MRFKLHWLLLRNLSLITALMLPAVYVHVPGVTVQTEPVKAGVVYAYTADWCGVCKGDKPELEKLKTQGVNIQYVDCTNGYPGVESVPIYQVYSPDNKMIKQTQSIGELKRNLKQLGWIK